MSKKVRVKPKSGNCWHLLRIFFNHFCSYVGQWTCYKNVSWSNGAKMGITKVVNFQYFLLFLTHFVVFFFWKLFWTQFKLWKWACWWFYTNFRFKWQICWSNGEFWLFSIICFCPLFVLFDHFFVNFFGKYNSQKAYKEACHPLKWWFVTIFHHFCIFLCVDIELTTGIYGRSVS